MIDGCGIQCDCRNLAGYNNRNGYHYINAGFWQSRFQKLHLGIDVISHDTTMEFFQNCCAQNNIDAFDANSINALVAVTLSARKGNVPLLEKLVEKIGIQILNSCDKIHFTPLHYVVSMTNPYDSYDMNELCTGMKALIILGANPNIPNSDCHTPLSLSALKIENMPLTKILIQNNAKMMPCISHAYKADGLGQLIWLLPAMNRNIEAAKLMLAVDISVLLVVGTNDEVSLLSMLTIDIINEFTLSIFNLYLNEN